METAQDRQVRERAKLICDYVRRWWWAAAQALGSAVLAAAFMDVAWWIFREIAPYLSSERTYFGVLRHLEVPLLIAGLGTIPIVFAVRQIRQAAALPYVPPAGAHSGALPIADFDLESEAARLTSTGEKT